MFVSLLIALQISFNFAAKDELVFVQTVNYGYYFFKMHIFIGATSSNLQKQRSPFQLWRHGDRIPHGTYPTDPYQEDYWDMPWGEITQVTIPIFARTECTFSHFLKRKYISAGRFPTPFRTGSKPPISLHRNGLPQSYVQE